MTDDPNRYFKFKLAGHLRMPVFLIDQLMPAAEFDEWIAFCQLEPLPDPHFSAALITSTLVNCHGGNASIEDYLPRVGPEPEPERLSPEQTVGILGKLFRGE